jgi:hypothetical protein
LIVASPAPKMLEPNRYVDRRAAQIDDPLERLAYLRGKMGHRRVVPAGRPPWKRLTFGAVVILAFSLAIPTPSVVSDVSKEISRTQMFPEKGIARVPASFATVWLVEEGKDFEVYSNGLRIDNSFSVSNQKRFYQVLHRSNDLTLLPEWHSQPVGIVYHTTESNIAPFEADQNDTLKHLAQSLVSHLRESKSYNFVIDRFGRVFRVVEETSAAYHAGNSIWADDKYAYLNLNNSFLGIAFEAQSAGGEDVINEAQVHAGMVLTEMLRAKYRIIAENCVTHAQVSVNPSNMRIGYHTDWARAFPFEEMGLPNNYDQPLASLTDFGFEYDAMFQKAIGSTRWRGLDVSEAQFGKQSAALGRSKNAFRTWQQERYRKLYSALKLTGAMEEGIDASAK